MTRAPSQASGRIKRSAGAVLREVVRFFHFYGEILSAAFAFAKTQFFKSTLPVTKHLLSRKPHPPHVRVNDIRANRIKLELKPSLSSPFNVEAYEISYAPCKAGAAVDETWQSVGCNDMTWRTVARLKGDQTYRFRVRSHNSRGVSSWSDVLEATTKLEPVEGGAYGPGYRWTQTDSEVCLSIQVPDGTQKKAVSITLEPQFLRMQLLRPGSSAMLVLEGTLPHRVRSWANGSYWELLKENGKSVLSVTLEKEHRAISVKFDYWRSFFVGHPEIDTHKIPVPDEMRNQLIQPGTIPASHLAAYGLNT